MDINTAKDLFSGSSNIQKVLRRSREPHAHITVRKYGPEAIDCLRALGYIAPAASLTTSLDAADRAYFVTPAGQDAPTRLLTVKI